LAFGGNDAIDEFRTMLINGIILYALQIYFALLLYFIKRINERIEKTEKMSIIDFQTQRTYYYTKRIAYILIKYFPIFVPMLAIILSI
jgi:hypothetical protein